MAEPGKTFSMAKPRKTIPFAAICQHCTLGSIFLDALLSNESPLLSSGACSLHECMLVVDPLRSIFCYTSAKSNVSSERPWLERLLPAIGVNADS